MISAGYQLVISQISTACYKTLIYPSALGKNLNSWKYTICMPVVKIFTRRETQRSLVAGGFLVILFMLIILLNQNFS